MISIRMSLMVPTYGLYPFFVIHHHMNPINTNDKNLHYKLLVVLSSGSGTMASPFLVTLL